MAHQEQGDLGEAMLEYERQQVKARKRPALPTAKTYQSQPKNPTQKEAEQKVLDYLSTVDEATLKELEIFLGVSEQVAFKYVRRMHFQLLVSRRSCTTGLHLKKMHYLYRLPKDGE